MLVAEQFGRGQWEPRRLGPGAGVDAGIVQPSRVHALAREFDLGIDEVMDLISGTPRMKMAVRGGVAEIHLHRLLCRVPGVTDCERLTGEGLPDVRLCFGGSPPITVECKNVLRKRAADGAPRLDFQRTRASKADPCSRYYSPKDFDLVAACLHAVSEEWVFRFHPSATLGSHKRCPGKLDNNVRVNDAWMPDPEAALRAIANR